MMVSQIETASIDDPNLAVSSPHPSRIGTADNDSGPSVEMVPSRTTKGDESRISQGEVCGSDSVLSPATQSTATNTRTTTTTPTTEQRPSRKLKAKLERKRSPYWSSEEESSSSASRPDTGSSSSDDTNEQRTNQQQAQKQRHGRYNRVTVRAAPRFNPPIGREIFKDDDDCSSVLEDDNNKNNSNRKLPNVPDLFFSSPMSQGGEKPSAALSLSSADIEICQRLDLEYERALEEREIGYNARYQSVRQSAAFIMIFMVFYLACGTAFFTLHAGWDFHDALFFSIYTMTTVGYGLNDNIPDRDIFLIFIMAFIFTGIATLTIMVAQVYQCIALEATRAQHARDRAEMSRKGRVVISRRSQRESSSSIMMQQLESVASQEKFWESGIRLLERTKVYFRDSEIGRGLSILFPFAGLIVIGAAVVGPMEGWSVIESLYFACVSLTTVGYGLYVPKNPIAIYFCIIWLPFSVGFMSLYLSNVASFYIRLSDRNIRRLEKQMRRRIKRAKQEADRSRLRSKGAQMGSDDSPDKPPSNQKQGRGFEMLSADDTEAQLVGTSAAEMGEMRRSQILSNSSFSLKADDRIPGGHTMQTMRDIIRTVKHNLVVNPLDQSSALGESASQSRLSRESEFMSIHSSEEFATLSPRQRDVVQHKPTFALRVLVQERFAEIIATDIAGFQSHIEIKENTLSVTINTLKDATDKWMVPRRARKAFRSVAFEALYFVGEHGLITRGAGALFDLTPFEFHGLFSPLLAAMGDAQVMEGWLAETDVLADVDLRREGMPTKSPTRQRLDDDNDVGGVAVDVHGRSREEDECGVEKRLENDHAETGATTLNG